MKSVVRCQLPVLTLQHFDFLNTLYDTGVLDRKTVEEMASEGIKGLPMEARDVIYPVTFELVYTSSGHLNQGKRKITVCKDDAGNRYIEADF